MASALLCGYSYNWKTYTLGVWLFIPWHMVHMFRIFVAIREYIENDTSETPTK